MDLTLTRQTNGLAEPWRTEPHGDPDNAWDPALCDEVEYVRVEDLRALETAPQPRDPNQVALLAIEIATDGFRSPLEVEVVTDSGSVYVRNGNHRLAAAELLGLEWVPVRTVESPGLPEGVTDLRVITRLYAPTHVRKLSEIVS